MWLNINSISATSSGEAPTVSTRPLMLAPVSFNYSIVAI